MSAHIMPQVHLEEDIDALGLSIRLGVEACRELDIGPQHLEELRPKTAGEPRVSVAHNAPWNSLKLHNVLDE